MGTAGPHAPGILYLCPTVICNGGSSCQAMSPSNPRSRPIVPLGRNRILDPLGSVPDGMVHVRVRGFGFGSSAPDPRMADYWIDKYDVTNRDFKTFIDRGGYGDPRYWHHPFVRGGQTLSWAAALAQFRDTTGRPGPATWNWGPIPRGRRTFR